jgi:hypothetical protein
MNLGIDLGTSRIVICDLARGVVLDEPSVIAVAESDGHVIAFGTEAESMLGRNPDTIRVVRPVRMGVIAEYELAEQLLRLCLARVCSARITKPCVAVSVAEQVTEVEQRSFIEAVISAGARRVTLVPETVAAAIGAGVDVSLPLGQMLVNVGGGTVDVSVLSLKGEAVSSTIRVAGDAMATAATLMDGVIVIGGGLAGASKYFMPALLEEMRAKIKTMSGDTLNRVQMNVYNLDNDAEFEKFAKGNSTKIKVYGTDREVVYDPEKRIGVTISDIGASNAVSLGAYLYAIDNI